jgi:predicted ABC-type ATPase
VSRVADRARTGGHTVPEEVIRRRYDAGLRNFFALYQPRATEWRIYDNSRRDTPLLIAAGRATVVTLVAAPELWEGIVQSYGQGT